MKGVKLIYVNPNSDNYDKYPFVDNERKLEMARTDIDAQIFTDINDFCQVFNNEEISDLGWLFAIK